MDVVLRVVLGGVVLPGVIGAALALAGAWVARGARDGSPREALAEALPALGVGAAVFGVLAVLAAAPPWPPAESTHWVAWGALIGGALAVVTSVARGMAGRWGATLAAALVAATAWWLMSGLLANLGASLGDPEAARTWTTALAVGTALLWWQLDAVAVRLPPAGFAVLATVLATGASVAVVLGRTALGAQLLGGVAAATGGIALVALLPPFRGAPLRAVAVPVAVAVGLVLATARHFAYLSTAAVVLVLLAPLVPLTVAALPGLTERLGTVARAAAVVGSVVALLGMAALTAELPEAPGAETEPGESAVELEYGYGSDDAESGGYDYGDMGNWKPPDAAP
jgi:hypothetical protein